MMSLQRSHIASGQRVPVHVDSTQRRSGKTLRRVRCMVYSFQVNAGGSDKIERTNVCIIGSGPAAHTAGIYAGRASLNPIMFEGFMAGGVAPGGQLTTTDILENFPGLPDDTSGMDFCDRIREQSEGFGTKIYTETVTKVDFSVHPLRVYTDYREVHAQTVVVATGATARRLRFPGSEEFWNRGISVCAVCDGSLPAFRGKPIGVVGGGDSAMTEALFMTKYGCKVYVIHRFDYFEASRFLASKVLQHPGIEVIWESEVVEGYGDDWLEGVQLRSNTSGEVSTLPVNGLFFAIGHTPNTAFLGGQLQLDKGGFIVTAPDSAATSVPGVFAAGDVQDSVFRQAVTSAGTGCMAAMESEWFISQNELLLPEDDGAPTLRPAPGRQVQLK